MGTNTKQSNQTPKRNTLLNNSIFRFVEQTLCGMFYLTVQSTFDRSLSGISIQLAALLSLVFLLTDCKVVMLAVNGMHSPFKATIICNVQYRRLGRAVTLCGLLIAYGEGIESRPYFPYGSTVFILSLSIICLHKDEIGKSVLTLN